MGAAKSQGRRKKESFSGPGRDLGCDDVLKDDFSRQAGNIPKIHACDDLIKADDGLLYQISLVYIAVRDSIVILT